jgi:hypothetical protein
MAVLVIGTCDTKAAELAYARDCIRAAGVAAQLVDVGTHGGGEQADVSAAEVAGHHPDGAATVLSATDRGVAVTAMAAALTRYLATRDDIDAVLGLGGTGNTALVTAALRALPVGLPKLMVSTVASGNVALCRGDRHHHDAFGGRHRRAQRHQPAGHRQRRPCRRRHGDVAGRLRRRRPAGDRHDHVRRHHPLRDGNPAPAGAGP